MSRPTGWENSYEIEITIDNTNVDSDLTDYPLCINLSASSGITSKDLSAIFDSMGYADRKKVAVFLSDKSTQCVAECECWDDTNEIATYHAKISSVAAASTTTIYFYLDPGHADNTTYVGDTGSTPGQTVWPSNHVGVWNLAQYPFGGAECILDSTGTGADGTPAGGMTSNDLVNAETGKGLNFDGTDDEIILSQGALLSPGTGAFSITVVLKSSTAGWMALYTHRKDGLTSVLSLRQDDNNKIAFFVKDSTSNYINLISIDSFNDGNYHVVCAVRSGNYAELFVDGISVDADTGTLSNVDVSTAIPYIAQKGDGYEADYMTGVISRVSFCNVALSGAWVKADNYNLKDTLLTFGDITEPYKVSGTVKESGSNVARKVRAYDNSTGDFLGEDTSNASTGVFEIGLLTTDSVYVVAIDDDIGDDYNALIYDDITPVAI